MDKVSQRVQTMRKGHFPKPTLSGGSGAPPGLGIEDRQGSTTHIHTKQSFTILKKMEYF